MFPSLPPLPTPKLRRRISQSLSGLLNSLQIPLQAFQNGLLVRSERACCLEGFELRELFLEVCWVALCEFFVAPV